MFQRRNRCPIGDTAFIVLAWFGLTLALAPCVCAVSTLAAEEQLQAAEPKQSGPADSTLDEPLEIDSPTPLVDDDKTPDLDLPKIDAPRVPPPKPTKLLPSPGDGNSPEVLPLGGGAGVPWATQKRNTSPPPGKRLANPHELLQLLGIDNSHLRSLVDGRPLHVDEWETMHRLLFRVPEFMPIDLDRWQVKDITWRQVAAEPEEYRAEVFQVTGRATMVTRVELPPEAADVFGYGKFYLVKLDLPDYPAGATLCARSVPLSLPVGKAINERVGFSGLFLKEGADQGLIFTADRMSWAPDAVNPALGATEDHVLLAEQGMDVGQLDRVVDRKKFVSADREAFYQMLDAVGHISLAEVRSRTPEKTDFSELLVSPNAKRGHLAKLEGTARRAVKIIVDDKDIQQRFGIDHYYEVDVFVSLDVPVRIVQKDGSVDLIYNNYPVVFITKELPEGLPLGDEIHEGVRLRGFFFKLWAYRSEFTSKRSSRNEQIAPMLIGPAPVIVPTTPQRNDMMGILFGGLFIVALFGVWVGLWRYSRSDAKFQRSTLSRQYQLEEKDSLDELGLHDAGAPDFRYLEGEQPAADASESPSDDDGKPADSTTRAEDAEAVEQASAATRGNSE